MANSEEFQVFWSASAQAAAKELATQARNTGDASRLVQILKDLQALLQFSPTVFGEPQWRRGNVEDRLGIREFVVLNY